MPACDKTCEMAQKETDRIPGVGLCWLDGTCDNDQDGSNEMAQKETDRRGPCWLEGTCDNEHDYEMAQ